MAATTTPSDETVLVLDRSTRLGVLAPALPQVQVRLRSGATSRRTRRLLVAEDSQVSHLFNSFCVMAFHVLSWGALAAIVLWIAVTFHESHER